MANETMRIFFLLKIFTYLKEHLPGIYTGLLLSGKLAAHLNEIDDSANAKMELLTRQMATEQGISEGLKARDQMA